MTQFQALQHQLQIAVARDQAVLDLQRRITGEVDVGEIRRIISALKADTSFEVHDAQAQMCRLLEARQDV